MKKFIKLIVLLCKCCTSALRVGFLDHKYHRLIRKRRYSEAIDAYEKMTELANEGMAQCIIAKKLMES